MPLVHYIWERWKIKKRTFNFFEDWYVILFSCYPFWRSATPGINTGHQHQPSCLWIMNLWTTCCWENKDKTTDLKFFQPKQWSNPNQRNQKLPLSPVLVTSSRADSVKHLFCSCFAHQRWNQLHAPLQLDLWLILGCRIVNVAPRLATTRLVFFVKLQLTSAPRLQIFLV